MFGIRVLSEEELAKIKSDNTKSILWTVGCLIVLCFFGCIKDVLIDSCTNQVVNVLGALGIKERNEEEPVDEE